MTYTHYRSFGMVGKSVNIQMRRENTPMTVKDVPCCSSQLPLGCGILIYFYTSLKKLSGEIIVNLNRLGKEIPRSIFNEPNIRSLS